MNLEAHYGMLLGLDHNWKVASVDLQMESNKVEILVKWTGGTRASCPECGKSSPVYDLREERTWRHLDTMQFETVIVCRTPRCKCAEHGVHTIKTPWADKNGRFTLMFEAFAIRVLLGCGSVTAASQLLGVSWHQVDLIRSRAVERGLERREEEPVEAIGIDEKSLGKHHDYVSVLTDLGAGRVLEVNASRRQEAAEELLESLSPKVKKTVKAIAMDMWPAFMNAASKILPEAKIVHDKFHVAKHLGEAVDKVRKTEHRELLSNGDTRLVGAKYLVLKNPENMKDTQFELFEQLRASGLKCGRAWAIKDLFREFWECATVEEALELFNAWYRWAVRSRLKPVAKVAKMLKKHLSGLLAYITYRITNAVTEGLNSRIQLIKASARGFRSFERYRVAILFYLGKLDMFPAQHVLPQKT